MDRVWILCVLVGGACGTETGNPEEFELLYNARSTDPGVSLGGGLHTSVSSVWLRLDDVVLDPDCSGQATERVAGLGFADHGGPEAARHSVRPARSAYCNLRTGASAEDSPQGEPEEVAGASVAVTGTLTDGRDFEIIADSTVIFPLTLAGAEPPREGAWLISFDVAAWLDVDALLELDGDPLIVSADSNANTLAPFVARLPSGVALFHDADANGQVDDEDEQISR